MEGTTERTMEGGVRPLRFVLLAGPGALAALILAAGIVGGQLSMGIASAQPITVRTGAGTARAISLDAGDISAVGGADSSAEAAVGAAIRARGASLASLCLIPRFRLPVAGGLLGIRLVSTATVRLDDVTLGVSAADIRRLSLPSTSIGVKDRASGSAGRAPGTAATRLAGLLGTSPEALRGPARGDAGNLTASTTGGPVALAALDSEVHRLKLSRGIRLTSVRAGAGFSGLRCH